MTKHPQRSLSPSQASLLIIAGWHCLFIYFLATAIAAAKMCARLRTLAKIMQAENLTSHWTIHVAAM